MAGNDWDLCDKEMGLQTKNQTPQEYLDAQKALLDQEKRELEALTKKLEDLKTEEKNAVKFKGAFEQLKQECRESNYLLLKDVFTFDDEMNEYESLWEKLCPGECRSPWQNLYYRNVHNELVQAGQKSLLQQVMKAVRSLFDDALATVGQPDSPEDEDQ